jgi:endoglucanase
MIENISLLEELVLTPGVSGFEDDISEILSRELENKFDENSIKDSYDNFLIEKQISKSGPKILICCHLDEVGFIVKKIDFERGQIFFEKTGFIPDQNLVDKKVSVATPTGVFQGKIIQDEEKNCIELKKGSEIDQVGIGNPISLISKISRHGKNRISSKSFDDRVGCFAILEMVRQLDLDRFSGTIQIAGFSKAELGFGGIMSPMSRPPDLIVYVDAVESGDVPGSYSEILLGGGVTVPISYSNDESLAIFPKDLIIMKRVAEKYKVKNQIGTVYAEDCLKKTVKNLYHICPRIISILIPTRYHHSVVEMVDFNDISCCKDILSKMVNP